jgi:hypothetical protein
MRRKRKARIAGNVAAAFVRPGVLRVVYPVKLERIIIPRAKRINHPFPLYPTIQE